jgi:molecular chaperone GrpE
MFLRSSSNSAAIRSLVSLPAAATARVSKTHMKIGGTEAGQQRLKFSSFSSSSSSSLFQTLRSHRPTLASPSCNPTRWLSSTNKKPADEEKVENEQEEANATTTTAETKDGDAATGKEDELNAQIKTLKDQLLRSYAEQENIRHIARNDVQAANSFAIKKFAKSLLDVADNLDRALEAVGKNDQQQKSKSPEFQVFYQGIELTKSGLIKALESNGVTAFCEEPGDVFNPEQHEALMEYPDPTATPGTIGQVIKKGYMLNGRVLRPAEVGVVKK